MLILGLVYNLTSAARYALLVRVAGSVIYFARIIKQLLLIIIF